MDLEFFITPGLGDSSYLLRSGNEAVLVDPQRDAWRFLAADTLGVRIRAVLETHVHNDYVSGAHEVRAATGVELVLPAGGGYEFTHRRAGEGDEVRIGDLRLTALATPGPCAADHSRSHLRRRPTTRETAQQSARRASARRRRTGATATGPGRQSCAGP
jgi:L-ascorbate metabolism protein UlaG (beta-lactamase superfamily)